MSVYVRGIPQLRNRIHELEQTPRGLLREMQIQTIQRAKDSVPVKTGKTKGTIRPGGLTNSYAIVRAGGAAIFIELGTRPHEIKPRNKKALFFPSQRATTDRFGGRAKLRFTRSGLSARSMRTYGNAAYVLTRKPVNHPGNAARPFLVPSAEDAVDNVLPGALVRAWNRGA